MQTFLIYLFKSTAIAAVFFGYYWLFLKDRRLNKFNRFYLIATVLISLIVPFIHFEWYHVTRSYNDSIFTVLQVMVSEPGEETTGVQHGSFFDINFFAACAYAFVSINLLVLLLLKIRCIYKLKRTGDKAQRDGTDIIYTTYRQAPFSFMNTVFWKRDIEMDSTEGRLIWEHELAHVRQRHTMDKLFLQVVACLLWANPFYWLISKEMSQIHEFLADEDAIKDDNIESLAFMILRSRYSRTLINVIQPFFHSPIKRRLSMLGQTNNTRYAAVRKLMLLPMLFAAVALISFKIVDTSPVKSKTPINIVLDAGHGGSDIGATGVNGLQEKDLSLRLVQKIKELAGQYNISVTLTRRGDENARLAERVMVSNNNPMSLFVSLHVNKNEDGVKTPDYQVYISDKNKAAEQSRVLASAMIAAMQKGGVHAVLTQKHLVVLNESESPAILIECGNIDDAKEMELLTNKDKQDKFCREILSGIVNYVNSK